ncbi:MAG: hypothetical protein NC236_00570 [Mycoplasma sp.]|nr:hypothetical protein [Mycoplasma sp.]
MLETLLITSGPKIINTSTHYLESNSNNETPREININNGAWVSTSKEESEIRARHYHLLHQDVPQIYVERANEEKDSSFILKINQIHARANRIIHFDFNGGACTFHGNVIKESRMTEILPLCHENNKLFKWSSIKDVVIQISSDIPTTFDTWEIADMDYQKIWTEVKVHLINEVKNAQPSIIEADKKIIHSKNRIGFTLFTPSPNDQNLNQFIKEKFRHILIKFLTMDKFKTYRNIFFISAYNDKNMPFLLPSNVELSNLILKGTSKKLRVSISRFENNSYQTILNHSINYVGKISEITHYDYDEKNTKKGPGKNMKEGYIMPYSFSGTFFPKFKFTFQDIPIPIEITTINKIPDKLLDVNNGLISIHISSDQNINIDNFDFEMIFDEKTREKIIEKDLSLRLLKMMSLND